MHAHANPNTFPVTLKDIVKVGLLAAVLLFASKYILRLVNFDEYTESFSHKSLVTTFIYIIQSLCLIAPIYLLVIRKYSLSILDFGVKKVSVSNVLKLIGSSFAILIALNFIFIYVMYRFNIQIPGFGEQEEHISLFGTQIPDIILGVLVLAVAAPIIEEFIFRGLLLQTLLKYIRPWMASLVTASLFGLIHFEFQTIAVLIILGLILNRTYLKTNSIIPGIAFHVINNSLAFTLEFWR